MLSRQTIINPIIRDYYLNSTKKTIIKMKNKLKKEKDNKNIINLLNENKLIKSQEIEHFLPFVGFLSITSFIILYYKSKI